MSDVQKRTKTTTRHEYVVPNPTVVDQIYKAIDWGLQDLPEDQRGFGDALRVEATDEEIIFYWVDP